MSSKKKRNKKIKPPEKKQGGGATTKRATAQLPDKNFAEPCISRCKRQKLTTTKKTQFYRFAVQRTDSRIIRRFIMHYFILMAVFVFLKESEFIQNIIDIK